MFRRLAFMALIPALLGASGPCSESGPSGGAGVPGTITGEGTIHQGVGPECPNTWHIATPDGRMLWPVEDPSFHVEGLRVRFSVRPVPDRTSFCMAGTLIEVLTLEKR